MVMAKSSKGRVYPTVALIVLQLVVVVVVEVRLW
jgi:hypothetical protein